MRKFSKIFESKDTLLTKLGTSEDEIKDMCTELTDEGYEITLSSKYIGSNGHIYYVENETSKYYPCIEVELHRETANKDEYGSRSDRKDQFSDVRNWNGGVYYEGNVKILKSVYELCYRFESTFSNGEAEVFFSMRSINEVNIRITFKLVESQSPIDFSEVNEYLSDQGLNIHDEYYEIEDSSTFDGGKTRNITIVHKSRWGRHADDTMRRIINSETKDDSKYLESIVKEYVDRLFEFTSNSAKSEITLKPKGADVNNDFSYDIMIDGKVLISIKGDFPIEDEVEVTVAKGIFKDRKEKITIRSVQMKVKLHY